MAELWQLPPDDEAPAPQQTDDSDSPVDPDEARDDGDEDAAPAGPSILDSLAPSIWDYD